MDSKDLGFIKLLASILLCGVVMTLALLLGFKTIDYYFPSKFDKLVHCNKAD